MKKSNHFVIMTKRTIKLKLNSIYRAICQILLQFLTDLHFRDCLIGVRRGSWVVGREFWIVRRGSCVMLRKAGR